MKRVFDHIRLAFLFLTRLPLPMFSERPPDLVQSVWCWPLVGAFVGAGGGLVLVALSALGLPQMLALLLAIFAMTLLTGALHEDGFADCADALGGATAERRLEIMKDSRLGSYGVIALIFLFAFRFAALDWLASFLGNSWGLLVLLAAVHGGSRAAMVMPALFAEPAKKAGLGAALGRPGAISSVMTGLLALAIVALGTGIVGLAPSAPVFLMAGMGLSVVLAAWFIHRRLGGYSGDSLGAGQIVGELAGWLVLILLLVW